MSIGWHKRALSHHAVPFFHFCCCVFSIEGSEYSYSKKLKLSENATVNEMRAAIRAAFPQLHGNFQLLRCEPNRRLVALPNDVDCPAKLKACVDMRRSALYVRPESVNISCWMFSVVTYKFLLCCAARPSLKPTCPTPHQFSNTPTITELLLLLYCYIFYSQQYARFLCSSSTSLYHHPALSMSAVYSALCHLCEMFTSSHWRIRRLTLTFKLPNGRNLPMMIPSSLMSWKLRRW